MENFHRSPMPPSHFFPFAKLDGVLGSDVRGPSRRKDVLWLRNCVLKKKKHNIYLDMYLMFVQGKLL